MERQHINERGSHTTIIEASKPVLDILKKSFPGIEVSPGKIESGVGAKSGSIKFKHINDELYEMVVVHNGSRQEFKVFSRASFEELKKIFKKEKKTREWSFNYTDMRDVGKSQKSPDEKYRV
ncbi:MAG: hypothetical protein KBC21_00205 [Candidatus Pacebacteria bacterium]|nr:hypothetical protein [Candidatus Paceibacterota bacterium]